MPDRIRILDALVAGKIAAGEVVDRPASVVKELIENSLDAGAEDIAITVVDGGRRLIRVVDDGSGMSASDARIAFQRHSTSKVSDEKDLERINTFGFRGEALSSVSAVAKVLLRTKERGAAVGTSVRVSGGGEPDVSEDGPAEGASIEVRDIFYNTPGRLKFLRSAEAEFARVADVVKRAALINPERSFRLINGSSVSIESAKGSWEDRIFDLFGIKAGEVLTGIKGGVINGFIGSHELTFASPKSVFIYVNRRPIRSAAINRAIMDGYGAIIDGGRYPFVVMDITVAPEDVDVNIHPAKTEVRFKDQRLVYDAVKERVRRALGMETYPVDRVKRGERTKRSDSFNRHFAAFTPDLAEEGKSGYDPASEGFEFTPQGSDGMDYTRVKTPELLDLRPIGQLWGEFLIAEASGPGDGYFYIIDQHGAEERCAFEALKESYYGRDGVKRQLLLLPERLETAPDERDAVERALDYLENFGFEIAPFGPSLKDGGETYLIKAVPAVMASRSAVRLVKDIAEDFAEDSFRARVEENIEAALMRIACHGVIRGQRRLTTEEGFALLKKLAFVDVKGYCPHGRPVIKKVMRREIEAYFRR